MSSTENPSSNFQSILDAALSDYAKQTGIDLTTHPSAHILQNCNSVDAFLNLLGDKERQFQEYRDGNRELINCLKPLVQALHGVSCIFGEATAKVPFPQTQAILVGIDVLLTTAIGISASYDALVDLLECIGNFLSRLQIYTKIPCSPSISEIVTKIMVETMFILSLVTKQFKQGRPKKYAKKLLEESEIESVLRRLDRLTLEEARMAATDILRVIHGLVSNLRVFIGDGMASMDDIWQALVTIQDMTSQTNKTKRDHLYQNIRSWLSPPDPFTNYNIAHGAQHDGTGEWFIQGSTFKKWIATGTLLWIHGNPGSGKTVLSSTIIQQIKMKCDRGLALMGYYFFDSKGITKQGIRGLIASLLCQFCAASDPCYQLLSDLYAESHEGSHQPDNETLIETLKETLSLPDAPMWCIIMDAIDECPNTSGFPTAREEFLDLLEDLVGLDLPNLRICVTSRPEVDIRTVLESLTSLHMSLHDQSGQKQDILDYIENVVHSDRRMRRWSPEDKQLVIETLSARADGMFRWVYCQLESLCRCLPTDIGRVLNELPESLDETYERTLLGIKEEKQEFAHVLLQCLTVSVRPFRVEELAEVLAIHFYPGNLSQYHVDRQLDDAQEAVLSTCPSLISVVVVDGCPTVKFSHFSVKDFLTLDRLANSTEDLSRFHVALDSAHTVLAQAALRVLLQIGDRAVDIDSIRTFPLVLYAAQHWVDHGRFQDVSSRIQDEVKRLFDVHEPSFATWIWICDMDYPFRHKLISEVRPPRPEASALYYATLCGFRDLVEHLISNYPEDVNAKGGRHGSAVNAALAMRNVEIALLLLGHGADVSITDANGRTALYMASYGGRRDHVELLLEHNADVDFRNGQSSETALGVAARMGELEIARLLIDHGASVDSQDNESRTPLTSASRNGHRVVAQLLIQNGAAVDTPNNNGCTPLFLASRYGHQDIVQFLIQSGAALDTPNDDNWTALHAASRYGHLDIVQFLIQSGASVDHPDNEGGTPLFSASRYGHPDIVRLLIQSGASVDSRDNRSLTPLIVACRNGHLLIAQILIGYGAAISSHDTYLSTPLHHASAKGHIDVVELLIANHADMCKRNEDQQTPLDQAAANGQLDIARLLLKFRSSPNLQDDNGSSSLHKAAYNGHLDLVKLLVESGADVNVRNAKNQIPLDVALASRKPEVTRYLANHMGVIDPCDGMEIVPLDETPDNRAPEATLTPVAIAEHGYPLGEPSQSSLHEACANGTVEAVQSLLDQGANINGWNADYEAALLLASRNGRLEVAKVLIEYGADVNCYDKAGWTPLMAVSRFGYPDIAEMLLDHGARVNAREEDFLTALHLASLHGCLDVVKVLLDRGADIDARDIDGRTPSGLASRTGGRDIVRLLSGVKVKS